MKNKECCHEISMTKTNLLMQVIVAKWLSYKPLIIIIIFCLILSFLQDHKGEQLPEYSMQAFMGYFFIFLSMFKFFDLKGFVDGFSTYDLITKRWQYYGYMYPFIEFFLGLAYLSNFHLFVVSIITVIVMIVSGLGVVKSVLSGQKIKCSCLGTVLNVPLSVVSIIENFGMGIMALLELYLNS